MLPKIFCWTKMGDDAGEPLPNILGRKEAERRFSGRGEFWWGVGEAPGKPMRGRLWKLKQSIENPEAKFTTLYSCSSEKPGNGTATLWTAYRDQTGIKLLPPAVIITSKPNRKRYYALRCVSRLPLVSQKFDVIDSRKVRNLGSIKFEVDRRQITAIVEQQDTSLGTADARQYNAVMRADLLDWVQLCNPRPLSAAEHALL